MKTFGYGLQAFTGGFQTGLGLGMENKKIKMLQEEQKRAEKLAKEKEENAMNWLNTNKDSLMNFHTQPQDVRNMLLLESSNYRKEWTDYLRDVEDFLQAGDLESLKSLNNMEEEKIKAERDMLGMGIRPENAFVGKYYDEKDLEYVKKLQIGKLPIKPIGMKMYEEEFGKLPPETKAPDLTGAINYLKKFPNPTPEQFNSLKTGAGKFYNCAAELADVTFESLWALEEPVTEPKGRAISLPLQEDYKQKALDANTWKDAEEVIDTYAKADYDTSEMPTEQEWIDTKLGELDSHVEMLEEITDENGRLKGSQSFNFMSGDKAESKTGEEWYKDIYEAYMFYLDELRKMGIDVSKYRKIKSPREVSKVGFLKGMFTGGGVERGYPSIYYTEAVPTPTETEIPKLPNLPSL